MWVNLISAWTWMTKNENGGELEAILSLPYRRNVRAKIQTQTNIITICVVCQ